MKNLLVLAALLLNFSYLSAQKEPASATGDQPKEKKLLPAQLDTVKQKASKAAFKSNMAEFRKFFVDEQRDQNTLRVMFYNVENLFDTINDPLTADEEFLPDGKNGWNNRRFQTKLEHTHKVLSAVGGWDMPEVVGFCELENREVLEALLKRTPMRKFGYDIVHENSADARGIDVGLIYRKDKFKVLAHEALRPVMKEDTAFKTRDVLYVKGIACGKDTLHIMVNHWPSRRGGQTDSDPKRMFVASMVRKKVDQILAINPGANIILIGDMNDHTGDPSIAVSLRAKPDTIGLSTTEMYDQMGPLNQNHNIGSHKYQGHWGTLDHIITSSGLSKRNKGGFTVANGGAHIFVDDFLVKEDERFFGFQPNRTYEGPYYKGGFSDHLPIYIDLKFVK